MENDPSKPETTFYALWRKWRPAVKIVVIESLFALAAGAGRAEAASAPDANYGVVIMRRFKPPSKTGVAGHHRASRQLAGPSGSPLFDNDRAAPDATVAAAQDRFSLVVRYLARSWGDISISPKKKIEKSQRPSFLRTTHCLEMGR